ncbi:MAG TPA: hypothetical protein VM575_18105 [Nocardioides sp.]|nr:hypothetical protein [Nocardioides sp.]
MSKPSREDQPTPQQKPKPRWRTYRRPVADEVEREISGLDGRPLVDESPGVVPARSRLSRRQLAACGVAAVAIGTGGFVFATLGEDAPEPYPREEAHVPIVTGRGLAKVAGELRARTGSTQVLDAWFEGDDEIRLSTPPAEAGDLADLWRWDGEAFEKWSAEKVGDRVPFDLTSIDPAVLVAVDEQARDRSDGDISASRAHVERPATKDDHWVYVKVDEVDRGGVVLWTDLRGHVEDDLVNESWRDD